MGSIYRKPPLAATSRRAGTQRKSGLSAIFAALLVSPLVSGCLPATATWREAELTGQEKIEMRDALREADGEYERQMILKEYDGLVRRREQDRAVQAGPPPRRVLPPLPREWEGPAVDERTLGGIVKQRGAQP